MIVDTKTVQMIKDFSDAKAPSGFEDETILVAKKYAENLGNFKEDKVRNFYITPKQTENLPVFMLDAHSDEVGFMVHSIKPNGTLRVVTLGGWNIPSLPSNKVLVHTKENKWIPGIFAQKPVHFMSAKEKGMQSAVGISDIIIDIGAVSKEEAEEKFKVRIGEPVVPDVKCEYDEEHDLFFGKAFDCRIGCAALIETMKRLQNENLHVNVKGVLSSQEEVGDRGIKVAANTVKPNIAICFEGCPADDTFTESYAIQTALKKGPMLRFMDVSVICSPRFQRFVLDLAEEKNIPVQSSVREGGGNNGAVVNLTGEGVPVVVIGIPVRYIHSQNCICSYEDFENAVKLAVETVKKMNQDILDLF